jgi:UDP-glucose 4-epimerase
MKIALTGGAGFIASNIADEYIALGHEVHIFDNLSTGKLENVNPKAKFHETDIRTPEIRRFFELEQFDIVNHHAAQMDVRVSVGNPAFDAGVNIIGSINVYEAAVATGVKKIIFASTGGAVYGEADILPTSEDYPPKPCSPYGISKYANEKYLYYYSEIRKIETAILRYSNVYGPRQNSQGEAGVVAIFIGKMLQGEQPYIYGDGLNTRDYVFVSDVVKANVLALSDAYKGIYNICTAIEVNVNEVFDKIKSITDAKCERAHLEGKQGEQRRSCCSYDKIKRELGWTPDVDLDMGLRLTVEYFKKNVLSK